MNPTKNMSFYRGRSGQWAFYAHRTSGILIIFFLLMHVVDVSFINIAPQTYDDIHHLYGNVVMRLFEIGLLGALVFHALNGLRIVIYDFFPGAIKREKEMLTAVAFVTMVLMIVGGYVILYPFFYGG